MLSTSHLLAELLAGALTRLGSAAVASSITQPVDPGTSSAVVCASAAELAAPQLRGGRLDNRRLHVVLLQDPARPLPSDTFRTLAPDAVLPWACTPVEVRKAVLTRGGQPPAVPWQSERRGGDLPLTVRELVVLRLADQGCSAADIASTLGISLHTARTHLRNVLAKLDCTSRLAAVSRARRLGLLGSPEPTGASAAP